MELSNILYGLVGELVFWQYAIILIVLTQPTIMAVTLYLHREQAHGAIKLHPAVSHFFRFWLWLTTGMKTREWVAVHRKHHARCETPQDPHSPVQKGLWHILFFGVHYYRVAAVQKETLEYVRGPKGAMLPNDRIEKKLYNDRNWLGLKLLLAFHVVVFGLPGLLLWLAQYLWIPFHAAGIINGVGHAIGYRNADTRNGDGNHLDASTNIVPWGLWIGGEELHNNHHLYPTSAKFSQRWFEVDIGWGVLRILKTLRLARIKHVSYVPRETKRRSTDEELFKIFLHHRWIIAKWFRNAREEDRILAASDPLQARFEQLIRARGAASATQEQFVSWLDDVSRSGKKSLVAFAQKIRSLGERLPSERGLRGA